MPENSDAILDELLALRCRRGDTSAWRELADRFERRLLYFIRRYLSDERDAWDVLQQTWLVAFKGLSQLAEPRAVRTWLYRIARNRAISQLRKQGADERLFEAANPQAIPDDVGDPREDAARIESAECVHAALGKLTIPHREVLTLHFLEEISVDEIAAITGVPPGTVKSRLHYAKRALRDLIEKEHHP